MELGLRTFLILTSLLTFNASASAMEVSLFEGAYSQREKKAGGSKVMEKTSISAGLRIHENFTSRFSGYAQASLYLRSYDHSVDSPDNSNDLRVGVGVRYWGRAFVETIRPHLSGEVNLINETDVSLSTASIDGYTTSDKNGIFYRGLLGLRFDFDSDLFFELEALLFESALNGKVKTTVTTLPGGEISESEVNATEIRGRSKGEWQDISLIIGMTL